MDAYKDLPATEPQPLWSSSISSLEEQMEEYRRLESSGASPTQLNAAAERINATIHTISGRAPPSYPGSTLASEAGQLPTEKSAFSRSPTLPSATRYAGQAPAQNSSQSTTQRGKLSKMHRPAREVFFDAESDASNAEPSGVPKKRNPAARVARGLLVVTVAPLAAAGMGLYVCGMALEGAAEILKGAGSLGKLAMVSVQGKSQRTSTPPNM